MKIFIVALLLAIGYAQTAGMDMSMLMPCKNRPADKCSGNSMEGVCRMNYNKVPARCEEGDPMDREDICASLQADACKAEKSCCWGMRENFFGKCSAIEIEMFGEMEFEDCPSSMLPRIFPSMGGADAGTSGAADASSGDSSSGAADASSGDASSGAADASSGDSSSGAADASSGDASSGAADASSGDSSSGAASGSATADQTQQASTYPFMTPNPPMNERTQTMLSCEVAGMQGPAACNALKAGNMFNPKVCGWNVKEGGCEEIELGKGNLCKTVADQETCNQQGDCCWDMKGYCGEYDFGDCLRPMPNMGNLMPNMGNLMPNMGNMGGMIGMEEQMEAHAEMAEAHAEMAENHAEMMGEMGGMQMGPGGMMMETEIEYEELPPVQSCDGLQFCHGREGMSPCVLDAQQKCVKMNMPSFGAPALRKTHTQDSAPFNYGHLLMVLGGGLIVGLAAGMCFQNLRSKNSIAPVLLEDNYRNI